MINLLTTIDENWLPYACMMLASVRRTTSESISCWVLHGNIPQAQTQRVRKWASEKSIEVVFVHIDDLGLAPPGETKWTRAALWGRYLVSEVVPSSITRCIYLDVDIVATRPLDKLMNVDLKGKPVGAVTCPAPHVARRLGLSESEYFNNGLLVVDTRRFDGRAYISRMQEYLKRPDLEFGPQCAFSLGAQGDVATLEKKWNVLGEYRAEWSAKAHVIHFTGDVKPWHYLSPDPLRPLVHDLIQTTPFPEAWEPDRTAGKVLRRMLRSVRNPGRHALVRKASEP